MARPSRHPPIPYHPQNKTPHRPHHIYPIPIAIPYIPFRYLAVTAQMLQIFEIFKMARTHTGHIYVGTYIRTCMPVCVGLKWVGGPKSFSPRPFCIINGKFQLAFCTKRSQARLARKVGKYSCG